MYLAMAIIFWIPLIFLMDEGHSIYVIIRVGCLDAEIHTYVVVAVYIVFAVLLLLIFRNFLIRLETLLAIALIKSCFLVFLRWIECAYVSLSHVARHRLQNEPLFSPHFWETTKSHSTALPLSETVPTSCLIVVFKWFVFCTRTFNTNKRS